MNLNFNLKEKLQLNFDLKEKLQWLIPALIPAYTAYITWGFIGPVIIGGIVYYWWDMNKNNNYKATYDELTGCLKKQSILSYVETLVKANIPFTILVLDIDHFRNFNNNYGHLVGDFVLKAVANELKTSIRQGDKVGRFGGEEFVLILPNCPKPYGYWFAEKIRKKIADKSFNYEGHSYKVTISVGVGHYPHDGNNTRDLFAKTDQALYKAKNNGRNKVEIIC